MATETELLKLVLAKPDDDAPRLAYAEWCAAQPDPVWKARAELIRLQLAASRHGQRFGGPAAGARQLIAIHGPRWIASGGLTPLALDAEFVRGFPECVTVKARTWMEKAPELRAMAPIRHLNLVGCIGNFPEAIQSETMEGIRSISIRQQGIVDSDLEALATSLHLHSLRWLSVAENAVTEAGAVAIAVTQRLPELRWVNFHENPFDPNERYSHDQGAVVESWLPPDGEALERRFGRLRWLRSGAENIYDTEPDRFTI